MMGSTAGSAFQETTGVAGGPPTSVDDSLTNTLSTDFDGINDYINIPDDASLNITNNITVSAWAKGAARTFDVLVSRFGNSAGNNFWFMRKNFGGGSAGQRIEVALYDGTSLAKQYDATTGQTFDGTTWHHYVFTFGTNVLKIYIDGAEATVNMQNDTLINSFPSGTKSHELGAQVGGTSSPFLGNIDEVSIWDAILTDTDISNIYNSGTPNNLAVHAKAANLQAWYRMGDGDTFPTVTDNSSNTNDGTMNNMDSGDFVTDVP
jgi:hypothetical protein